MASDSSPPALRFIKKVPASGGSPAYKLTLPHQIVNRRLQHFVDSAFELASSATAEQTWEANIAPRRNKDRSEYILQGWKLFAEAHNLQAGDQVSFELAGARRLVVKCIQTSGANRPAGVVRSSSEIFEPDTEAVPPLKSHKSASPSLPGRMSSLQGTSSHLSQQSAPMLQALTTVPAIKCTSSLPLPAEPADEAPMADRVQSWLSFNHLPSSSAPVRSLSSSHLITPLAAPSPRPTLPDPAVSHDHFLAQLQEGLPGIFDDMTQDLDSVVPDVPLAHASGLESGAALGSFASSIDQTHYMQHTPMASEIQSNENDLRALVSSIQDRLDHSTRTALQATMGLEACAMDIMKPAAQRNKREVQAKMFRFLSSLKESLWQVLVVASDANINEKYSF